MWTYLKYVILNSENISTQFKAEKIKSGQSRSELRYNAAGWNRYLLSTIFFEDFRRTQVGHKLYRDLLKVIGFIFLENSSSDSSEIMNLIWASRTLYRQSLWAVYRRSIKNGTNWFEILMKYVDLVPEKSWVVASWTVYPVHVGSITY